MNLKYKMSQKLTMVAEFISDTCVLISDECSPQKGEGALRMLEGDSFEDLVVEVKDLCILLASKTRFRPVICLIKGKYQTVDELDPKDADDSDNPFKF